VIQIGNVPYAIVNAPNEPTSRYVREGQSLANGQVIVRRIDALMPEPIVVFEQFGIEVTATVGQGGPATPDASPTAAVSMGQPAG
jgi:molybdopterin biosynthesis enzyme